MTKMIRLRELAVLDDTGKAQIFVDVILMTGSPNEDYNGEYVKYFGSAGARDALDDPDWKPLLN